ILMWVHEPSIAIKMCFRGDLSLSPIASAPGYLHWQKKRPQRGGRVALPSPAGGTHVAAIDGSSLACAGAAMDASAALTLIVSLTRAGARMARPWSARCYGVARQREGSRQNSIGGRLTLIVTLSAREILLN